MEWVWEWWRWLEWRPKLVQIYLQTEPKKQKAILRFTILRNKTFRRSNPLKNIWIPGHGNRLHNQPQIKLSLWLYKIKTVLTSLNPNDNQLSANYEKYRTSEGLCWLTEQKKITYYWQVQLSGGYLESKGNIFWKKLKSGCFSCWNTQRFIESL